MPKYKIKVVGWEINENENSITINPNTVKDGGDEIELKFKNAEHLTKFIYENGLTQIELFHYLI